MTIELLLASIEDEDQRSFAEKLYLDHCQLMISIAYRILRNHDEAEDVMMTMMLKFTDNVEYYMQCPPNKLTALVVVCTKNAAIDAYRKKKTREKWETKLGTTDREGNEISDDIEDPDYNATVDSIALSNEAVILTKKALKRLKETDKEIILLRTIHRLPSKVVAELLGISVNAVDQRLKKARKRLMNLMEEMKKEDTRNG